MENLLKKHSIIVTKRVLDDMNSLSYESGRQIKIGDSLIFAILDKGIEVAEKDGIPKLKLEFANVHIDEIGELYELNKRAGDQSEKKIGEPLHLKLKEEKSKLKLEMILSSGEDSISSFIEPPDIEKLKNNFGVDVLHEMYKVLRYELEK